MTNTLEKSETTTQQNTKKKFQVGYLSAGPRVSTRDDAEMTGSRTHVVNVIHAFEKLGHTVHRYIVGDRMPKRVSGKGSEKIVTGNPIRTMLVDFMRITLGIFNARFAWRELHNEVDFVYERLASLQSLGNIFQKRGIPWVLESNTLFFKEAKQDRNAVVLSGLARRLEIAAYHECSLIVAVTEDLKQLIVQESGVDSEKVLVIPNGVNPDLFAPDAHTVERFFDDFTLGFVGALYEWQAINLLLDAIHELKREEIIVNLVVVGDGQMYEAWQAYAAELGLQEQVKFTGRVPWSQVPRYINGFDACFSGHKVTKANKDGHIYMSPLKLYEYMSMAKPVIVSRFGGTETVIESGKTGLFFEPENLEDLKSTLREAYQSPDMLRVMGEHARAHIIESHSWQSRIDYLMSVLLERGIIK